jgi:hypothetical protein
MNGDGCDKCAAKEGLKNQMHRDMGFSKRKYASPRPVLSTARICQAMGGR